MGVQLTVSGSTLIAPSTRHASALALHMHIYLVDDDPKLLRTLKRGFEDSGYRCDTFPGPEEVLALLLDKGAVQPDVVLLDVMMPGTDGWDLLKRLRAEGIGIPTIFLTARQEVDERVRGLELGADDYVIKPFAFKELLARIHAVLRRHGVHEPLVVGELIVRPDRNRVEYLGRQIETSDKEHELLVALAKAPGRVFSRAELLKLVWQIEFDPGTNIVDVMIARLRRKLAPHGTKLIETVFGEGYRLRANASDAEKTL
ncbi:MAG: DNA-binding response OmpR family regulator [Candidatus Paceibacteria bacterium]|jgi:DNA-binding response OmpR family regulator